MAAPNATPRGPRRAQRRPEARADFDCARWRHHRSGTPVAPVDDGPHTAERDGSVCPLAPGPERPAGVRLLNAARVDRLAARTRNYLPATAGARSPSAMRGRSGRAASSSIRPTGAAPPQRLRRNSDSRWSSARAPPGDVLLGRDAARGAALRARG